MTASRHTTRPAVVVFGAANIDTFYRVAQLPTPGETVLGAGPLTAVGGKGANQAIAVAKTGVESRFLGAVGNDPEGGRVIDALVSAGVNTAGLVRDDETLTGRAIILVDDQGRNVIIVAPAANSSLSPNSAVTFAEVIGDADVLVVQGEVPVDATTAVVELAAQKGVRVILNLAPFVDLATVTRHADPLVLNEIEASQLLGRAITGPESAQDVAELAAHSKSAVVTLGAAGAFVVEAGCVSHVPAPTPKRVVDTTGAGDAFVGVLAAALATGHRLEPAVRQAVQAATTSVEVLGAGESYPEFVLDPVAAVPDDDRKVVAG